MADLENDVSILGDEQSLQNLRLESLDQKDDVIISDLESEVSMWQYLHKIANRHSI